MAAAKGPGSATSSGMPNGNSSAGLTTLREDGSHRGEGSGRVRLGRSAFDFNGTFRTLLEYAKRQR